MKASDTERSVVLAEGEQRGWPAAELDACIAIESAWDPAAFNRSTNAGGLIGFMPFVLPKVGWPAGPEAFRRLSAAEQAPYVGRYFDVIGKRWSVPGDTYLALAAPSYVGASDGTVVYARDSKAWKLNPGWRGADGEITAGSIRAVCLRKMQGRTAHRPRPEPSQAGGAALALLVLGWLWYRARHAHHRRRNVAS